jgi:DNA invertase Pin-like site-specific DNA recombinase
MKTHKAAWVSINGQEKIVAAHLERTAYIYIRQSSLGQVLNNKESALNQRRMAERAVALGWPDTAIRIINADQGLSGTSSDPRLGFREMLAEVALGHVGIIFSYEVARLSRNNTDWYRLLDLAAVFNTLIGDYDGIYDLNLFNDRLLLGLKGTISEAELHYIQLRMVEGRMRQIERGEYRQALPTGLIRLADGRVVKDPDDQIRHTITLVFTKFEELGSARQVFGYLRDANIRLPRRHVAGPHAGELLWKRPTPGAVYSILKNPAYAGAFAYGRNQADPARRASGQSKTGMVGKPMAEWIHLQQDVYPAYISWKQYMTNQEQLRQNMTDFRTSMQPSAQGVAREGALLLQGLVSCGSCGYRMTVRHERPGRYICEKLSRRLGEPLCASFQSPAIDATVIQAFFEAIQPAQLDVLESVLAAQQAEHGRLLQHWEEQLNRAQYEARLAQRQYDAVDPDNRLVAGELERRWEEKLRNLRDAQQAYDDFVQTSAPPAIDPELREQFHHISETLPSLWAQISHEHQKALLRSLISGVVLTKLEPGTVEIRIIWVSGHYSILHAHTSISRNEDIPGYERMIARIETLWRDGFNDAQIAAQLTSEGFRSAWSIEVNPLAVRDIRRKHGWTLWNSPGRTRRLYKLDGYLTVPALAQRLGVSQNWVRRRIHNGQIDPQYVTRRRPYNTYLIQDVPQLMEHLQRLVEPRCT